MLKSSLLFKKNTSFTSELLVNSTENAKFSGYYLHLNTIIYEDFQICISVPLRQFNCVTFITERLKSFLK